MLRIFIGIVLVLSAVVPPIVAVADLISGLGAGTLHFLAPGSTGLTVTEAGRWYLYHDHHTLYEGRVFKQSPGLPAGTRIRATDAQGRECPMAADRAQVTVTSGSTSSVAVTAWDLEPGTYSVHVEGSDFEAVCSLAEMRVLDFVNALLRAIALSLLLILVGVVIIIFGVRARRRQSAVPKTEIDSAPMLPDR